MLSILHPFARSITVTNGRFKIEWRGIQAVVSTSLRILFSELPEYDRSRIKTFSETIDRFFITIFDVSNNWVSTRPLNVEN